MAFRFDYTTASKNELLSEITARQREGRSINPKSNSLGDLADALKADDATFHEPAPAKAAKAVAITNDSEPAQATSEPVRLDNLARLWQGGGPAPKSLQEYRCRLVATGPDFFRRYNEAETRYAQLRQMGSAVAAFFQPRPDPVPALLTKAAATLDVEDAKQALAAWQQNVAFDSFLRLYRPSAQAMIADAPARKLEREFPSLHTELVQGVLEPALKRVEAELARIRPLEERRLREAAEQEAIACGLSPSKAKTPPTSAVVLSFEAFAAELSQTIQKVTRGSGSIGETSFPRFWFEDVQPIICRLRDHYQAWLAGSAAEAV